MALIKCTECGEEISDSAKICPHCGSETAHGKIIAETKTTRTIHLVRSIMTLVIIIIGAVLFFSGYNELAARGFSFFSDDWLNSNFSSIRNEGLKCAIGITLIVTCIIISISIGKAADSLFNHNSSTPEDKKTIISGRCDLCDAQGTTAICRIPELPGNYELCTDCIDQYMAQIDDSHQS